MKNQRVELPFAVEPQQIMALPTIIYHKKKPSAVVRQPGGKWAQSYQNTVSIISTVRQNIKYELQAELNVSFPFAGNVRGYPFPT